LRASVRDAAAELGAANPDDVALAVSEACTNAIKHAYPDGSGPVRIDIFATQRGVHADVRDWGVGLSDSSHGRYGLRLIDAATRGLSYMPSDQGTGISMLFPMRR